MRVMICANHATAAKLRERKEGDVDLFGCISEELRVEIHSEMYLPSLMLHPFFRFYSRCDHKAVQKATHSAVATRTMPSGERLCYQGEAAVAAQMFFVSGGMLLYLQEGEHCYDAEVQRVKERKWVCEPALWIAGWAHAGSLRAATSTTLLMVNGQALAKIV